MCRLMSIRRKTLPVSNSGVSILDKWAGCSNGRLRDTSIPSSAFTESRSGIAARSGRFTKPSTLHFSNRDIKPEWVCCLQHQRRDGNSRLNLKLAAKQ